MRIYGFVLAATLLLLVLAPVSNTHAQGVAYGGRYDASPCLGWYPVGGRTVDNSCGYRVNFIAVKDDEGNRSPAYTVRAKSTVDLPSAWAGKKLFGCEDPHDIGVGQNPEYGPHDIYICR